MPEKQPSARLTPSEARKKFLDRSEKRWDSFNAWYKANPEGTFDEMEEELGRQRRAILGDFVELSLRQGDLGATAEAPNCPKCGKPVDFKGYPSKTVNGLEVEVKIQRAYYHCSACKAGFSPPGPASEAEEG